MDFEVRELAIIGVLGAVAIMLSFTPLGFIPVPTPAGSATIMHIPVIIGAILEGPLVGALIGLIFGLASFIRGAAFFSDPLVAILPRILIGICAAYSYYLTKDMITKMGSVIFAAIIGTAVNTSGVLTLALLRGYLPNFETALSVALTHGIPEIVVAVIITVAIIKALQRADISSL
ncbi:MAG: ECF transporter S component [Bacillota bacterium]